MADKGQAFGWDDEVEVKDNDFEVLPAGEYAFEVVNFKRERFDGSAKMAACPVAVLQLKCQNVADDGATTGYVFDRLYLNSKALWRISNFFKCVRLIPADAPSGTNMPMSLFNKVVGLTGRCNLTIYEYENNGKKNKSNDVDYIVPKAEAAPMTIPESGSLF